MAGVKWTKDKKDDAIQIIIHRLSQGEALRHILPFTDRPKTLPHIGTFYTWIKDSKGLNEQYARACEARADKIFEEILEIADDGTNDTAITPDGREIVNHDVYSEI